MWFKKKRKIDPRIRFQSPNFTRQVQVAGRYKRNAKPFPETPLGQFLLKLGLDSVLSRIIVAAALLFFIYIIYLPNFVSVRTVNVSGVNGDEKNRIAQLTEQYLKTAKVYWPQRNLLLLSASGLKNYLLAHDSSIYNVSKVQKKFFHTLNITVVPKTATYVLAMPDALATIYNDGSVMSTQTFDQPTFDGSSLRKLKQAFTITLPLGENYIPEGARNSMDLLYSQFNNKTQTAIDYLQVPPLNTQAPVPGGQPLSLDGQPNWREIIVEAKKSGPDFEVRFDTENLNSTTLDKLNLLLGALTSAQQNTLFYVDMRFGNKGYVCFVNFPCSQPLPAPVPTSSSSQTTTTTPPATK